jgi:hypothetical protein
LAEESLAKRVHISSPSGCSEPIESDFSNDVEVLDVSQQGRRTDLAEESLAKRVHISSPSGCSEPIESDFSNDVEVLTTNHPRKVMLTPSRYWMFSLRANDLCGQSVTTPHLLMKPLHQGWH